MKKFAVVFLIAAAFAGGYVYARWFGRTTPAAAPARKILYWVDPMHPQYKSDKPGIAPDCGMKLEPVYASATPAAAPGALPPGAVGSHRRSSSSSALPSAPPNTKPSPNPSAPRPA